MEVAKQTITCGTCDPLSQELVVLTEWIFLTPFEALVFCYSALSP